MLADLAERRALGPALLAPGAELAVEARLMLAPIVVIVAVELVDLALPPLRIMRVVPADREGPRRAAEHAALAEAVSGAGRRGDRMGAVAADAADVGAIEARPAREARVRAGAVAEAAADEVGAVAGRLPRPVALGAVIRIVARPGEIAVAEPVRPRHLVAPAAAEARIAAPLALAAPAALPPIAPVVIGHVVFLSRNPCAPENGREQRAFQGERRFVAELRRAAGAGAFRAGCIAPCPSLSGAPREARGCSSDGRALQSHCRGQGFDSPQLHQPSPLRGFGWQASLIS